MSSHRSGGAQRDSPEAERDNEPQANTTAAAPQPVPTPTPPLCLEESTLAVILDEEDSYRVVWEHDQHLARIRAYTDFFDTLALLRRAAHGGRETPQERRQRAADAAAQAGAVGSPAPSHPLSGDRTPTDAGDRTLRSESVQLTPFTSMDRELILASTTPQSAYGTAWNDAAASGGGGAADEIQSASVVMRLEAERQRLAQELAASQTQVRQLQTSLQAAQKGAASSSVTQQQQQQGTSRPPLRPPLASTSSLSSLTTSMSRGHSATPPPSEPFADPSTAPTVAGPPQQPGEEEGDGDEAVVVRRATQQFLPQSMLQPLRQPSRPRRPSPSPSRSGGRRTPSQAAHAAPPSKPIDVADFFWTLRVAPPPADLHERCGHADHCPVTPNLSIAPADGSGGGMRGYRNYGAIPAAAAAAATHEQSVALACESAWVDSSFYCYNILEEMSCLRVVRSWDDVVQDAAVGSHGKPVGQMTEEEVTRVLLDRTPAATPSAQSLQSTSTPIPVEGQSPALLWPAATSVHAARSPDGVALMGGAQTASASAVAQRYRLPYLQRLWVTSVLRQYLLFLLVTITCVLLLIPTMMIGTVNVFEAADGDDFYATRNRFGRSAQLVVARLGSCALVFLFFFGFVCAEGGRRHATVEAAAAAAAAAAATAEAAPEDSVGNAASPPAASSELRRVRFAPLGALVHAALCISVALLFAGSLLFNRSCAARSLPFALLAMALYGAGEALLIGSIGTIVSADIGVVAGVNVSLLLLLSNWLLVNAFGAFVLPKLSYYIYSPSQLLKSQVYSTGAIGALVFALMMLSPQDLIERAAHAHARFLSPRKLLSAARHDVSVCFYLRALTVALLTSAVVLVMVTGAAVFVPPQAEAASMSESAKTKELMGTGSGKRGTANTASDAAFIAESMDRWLSQQRHASVYLFAFALLFVPLCFIPRLAGGINRWCPVALMTTLLCLLWCVSTAISWATVLGYSTKTFSSGSSSDAVPEKKGGRLWKAWIWTGEHHLLTPSTLLCGMATGVIYTIVVSSLLRSIANAGVQLPVLHPAQWRMAFHERDRRLKDSISSSSGTGANEGSPLVSGNRAAAGGEESALRVEVDFPDAAAAEEHEMEERMRCVRMQLRGGPAVMTVLAALLIMIVLLACVTVSTVAAALLTDRTEKPIYVNAVMPGVSWDEHLLAKTVVTCVIAAAMAVQWVEVFHRVCCSCCC